MYARACEMLAFHQLLAILCVSSGGRRIPLRTRSTKSWARSHTHEPSSWVVALPCPTPRPISGELRCTLALCPIQSLPVVLSDRQCAAPQTPGPPASWSIGLQYRPGLCREVHPYCRRREGLRGRSARTSHQRQVMGHVPKFGVCLWEPREENSWEMPRFMHG